MGMIKGPIFNSQEMSDPMIPSTKEEARIITSFTVFERKGNVFHCDSFVFSDFHLTFSFERKEQGRLFLSSLVR